MLSKILPTINKPFLLQMLSGGGRANDDTDAGENLI